MGEKLDGQASDGLSQDALWSHACGWEDLLVPIEVGTGRESLDLDGDWLSRWTATWGPGTKGPLCTVRELVLSAAPGGGPTRWFTWRRDQRHRPGLQYLVSTDRHHGAESLEEAGLLLALDFAGELEDVVSQPLRLHFGTGGPERDHTPDYLAVTRIGVWLIDVRPEALIGAQDRQSFAAAAEVALACGWHYTVAGRWREHVSATLSAFSSRRRELPDPLGLRPALLAAARDGGTFGELTEKVPFPPLARAQLLHLLWHRRLGIDLRMPFGDSSAVVDGGGSGT